MSKIKIAQIGTGHDHASTTFAALRRLPDIFEVVGYAQVPEDDGVFEPWAYEGTKEYSVDEILNMSDLDAVTVETFDLNLVKYAQKAADKGLHVQMDKMPDSVEGFEKLLSTVKKKDLAFNIGYMYRFNPLIRQAFEKAKSGELGRIYSVEADMSCIHGKEKREWLGKLPGGMMQYLGCHLVDLIVRMLGVPDEIIPYNYATGYDGVKSKDVAFAVLKYPNGISTVKTSALDCGGYVRRSLAIHGEKGTIEIRPLEKNEGAPSYISTKATEYHPEDGGWTGYGKETKTDIFDRYELMLTAFAAMVRGEKNYEVDLETEAIVNRCALAACGTVCDYKKSVSL